MKTGKFNLSEYSAIKHFSADDAAELSKNSGHNVYCRFGFHHSKDKVAGYFFEKETLRYAYALEKGDKDYPSSFENFKAAFIQEVQTNYVLTRASEIGQVMVPINYILEFWTPDFVCRLCDHLRQRHKRHGKSTRHLVKQYLKAAWNDSRFGLSKMTPVELAAFLNKTFNIRITPAAAKQMAYNWNLFTENSSGPKQRKQTTSKL